MYRIFCAYSNSMNAKHRLCIIKMASSCLCLKWLFVVAEKWQRLSDMHFQDLSFGKGFPLKNNDTQKRGSAS